MATLPKKTSRFVLIWLYAGIVSLMSSAFFFFYPDTNTAMYHVLEGVLFLLGIGLLGSLGLYKLIWGFDSLDPPEPPDPQ